MRTQNTGVVSSIPPCVTSKTPWARKVTGNHLVNATSLEKTQIPVSGFCYAQNREYNSEFACNASGSLIAKRSKADALRPYRKK